MSLVIVSVYDVEKLDGMSKAYVRFGYIVSYIEE